MDFYLKLHKLISDYVLDGFTLKVYHGSNQSYLIIQIPKGRALYNENLEKFMKTGYFDRYCFQNNSEVWFMFKQDDALWVK